MTGPGGVVVSAVADARTVVRPPDAFHAHVERAELPRPLLVRADGVAWACWSAAGWSIELGFCADGSARLVCQLDVGPERAPAVPPSLFDRLSAVVAAFDDTAVLVDLLAA